MSVQSSENKLSGRPSDVLSRRVAEVCDAAGVFIEYWGFKAIHGRVWTLLALRSSPLSQSEIADTLAVSRSLISASIAELAGYGLVRAVGEHRNAPYEAVMDIWPAVSKVLRSREWMLIEAVRVSLEAAIDEGEYLQSRKRPVPYSLERMRALLSMTQMAQNVLQVFMRMRIPLSSRDFGRWFDRATAIIRRVASLR